MVTAEVVSLAISIMERKIKKAIFLVKYASQSTQILYSQV